MTSLASLNWRNARKIRKACVRMTVTARNMILSSMHTMAKRYRLPNTSLRQPRKLRKRGNNQARNYSGNWQSKKQARSHQVLIPQVFDHGARPILVSTGIHRMRVKSHAR